jgi:hypothetical protein
MTPHRKQVGNLPGIDQLDREAERFRRQAAEILSAISSSVSR